MDKIQSFLVSLAFGTVLVFMTVLAPSILEYVGSNQGKVSHVNFSVTVPYVGEITFLSYTSNT